MEHHEIEEQLTAYLLGDLAPEQAKAMREHLDECDDCRALAKELEPTLDLLRGALAVGPVVPVRLDDERKEEIFAPRQVPATVTWLAAHRSVLTRVAGVAAVAMVLFALLIPASNNALRVAREVPDERQFEGFDAKPEPAAAQPVTRGIAEDEAVSDAAPMLGDTPMMGRLFKGKEGAAQTDGSEADSSGNVLSQNAVGYVRGEAGSMDDLALVDAVEDLGEDSSVRYLVKKGDTLTAIAAANETSVRELAELNKLQNPDSIQAGGSLAIPETESAREHRWADASGPQPSAEPVGGAGMAGADWGIAAPAETPARRPQRFDVNGEADYDAHAVTDVDSVRGLGLETATAAQDVSDRRRVALSRGNAVSAKEWEDGYDRAPGQSHDPFYADVPATPASISVRPVDVAVPTAPEMPGLVALNGSRAADSDEDGIRDSWGRALSDGRKAEELRDADSDVKEGSLLVSLADSEQDDEAKDVRQQTLSFGMEAKEIKSGSEVAGKNSEERFRVARPQAGKYAYRDVDGAASTSRPTTAPAQDQAGTWRGELSAAPAQPNLMASNVGTTSSEAYPVSNISQLGTDRASEGLRGFRKGLEADYEVSKHRYEELDRVLGEANSGQKIEDLSELSEDQYLAAEDRLHESREKSDKDRDVVDGLEQIEDRRFAQVGSNREREVAQVSQEVEFMGYGGYALLEDSMGVAGEDGDESMDVAALAVSPQLLDLMLDADYAEKEVDREDFGEMGGAKTFRRTDIKQYFQEQGVPFPPGTQVKYNAGTRELMVKNTPENLELLEKIIEPHLDPTRQAGSLEVADVADAPAEPESEPELVARAYGVNPFVSAVEQPFSTFAIDVDTAAYTLMRKHIQNGVLPPAEAVRTEEFVNFFDYDYRAPERQTFAVYTSLAPTPFGDGRLLKIGVKGKRLGREEQRPAVLTFVIDTSGSMDTPDRLGLVRRSLDLLIEELGEADQVAIVQVDSQARLILPPTTLGERNAIAAAIDGLQCSGSTHLEDGIKLGYEVAAQAFTGGSVNRVLLLSDGAANLGSADAEQILSMVESHRSQGIFCSVFGFGIGAYNDEILEQLANKGDGSYRFIDSQEEAKRVFVDELAATLHVIASDVKIQVEFYPEQVKTYRQLGYENRQLTKEQFRDDGVDAGEVGSGESVTALYELVAGVNTDQPLGVVRVRYRDAATGEVEEIAHPIRRSDAVASFEEASPQFRLAAAAAEFAEILRGSPFADGADYGAVADVLRPVALDLRLDQRVQELLQLVQRAPGLPRASGN